MSQEALHLGDAEVANPPTVTGRPNRRYRQVAGMHLPPGYLCAAVYAAIQLTWRNNAHTNAFLAKAVQRLARWLRDDGANPETMLIAFNTIFEDQLGWVSAARGAEAGEELRLKIVAWAVEEFYARRPVVAS